LILNSSLLVSKRGGKCSTTANCDAQLACLNGTCQRKLIFWNFLSSLLIVLIKILAGVDVGGSCTSNLECNAGLACSVEYGRRNGKCLSKCFKFDSHICCGYILLI